MKKVLAGGRFNAIHPGHIHFLKKAKSLGDFLVVVVASDSTIRNAGKKVVFPLNERKRMLESIRFVDRVIPGREIMGEMGYMKVIMKEKPDIISLGYDQELGPRLLEELKKSDLKVKIKRIGNYMGYSTSGIITQSQ